MDVDLPFIRIGLGVNKSCLKIVEYRKYHVKDYFIFLSIFQFIAIFRQHFNSQPNSDKTFGFFRKFYMVYGICKIIKIHFFACIQ